MATPTLVGTPIRTGFASVRNVSTGNVATGGTLLAGDQIASFIRAGTNNATATIPATWVNPPGGNTVVNGTSGVSGVFLYHTVTAAEQSANTVAWTLSNLWDVSQTGASYTTVVRGGDQAVVIDAMGNLVGGSPGLSHQLAGLNGTDIAVNGGLVLSGVGADTSTTYAAAPTGWTMQVKNAGGQNTGALLSLNAATSMGVDLAATVITAAGSSSWASLTLVFTAAGATPSFFRFI